MKAMAKRRKSTVGNHYHNCMSGKTGEIHKQREKLKKEIHKHKFTPHQAGQALSRAAKICSR